MATLKKSLLHQYKVLPTAMMWLVVLAILVRAAIPAGFMPNMDAGQPMKMVICSLDGPKTILVDKDLNPYQDRKDSKSVKDHSRPCDFSINTAFTDIPSVIVVASVLLSPQNKPEPLTGTRFVSVRFFGNASSRSPPVSSYA